ncbi:MFS transporter [Candidatus Bathyarchaeota archaeon]|nr:MFS transporter [Candidatus Bathyarchaeota archaeon]
MRLSRRKMLISSIFLGTISTIMIAFAQETILEFVCLLLGASLGLGLPSSMAIAADYTVVEERGRVSGTIILTTFIIAFASIAIIWIFSLAAVGIALLLAVLRSSSFLALAIDKCERLIPSVKKKIHLPVTANREFLFYIFPWVMFSIASSLAWNVIPPQTYAAELVPLTILRYVFIALFGLVAGVIADRFGRKYIIIIGLIVLGVAFAMLGFSLSNTGVIWIHRLWYVYLALSGVTWGSFFVVFLTVPGDLSDLNSREKFYALVVGIFSVGAIPVPDFSGVLPVNSLSQILSIILFLSIVPVLRSKETLHESKIQKRRIKEHMEKIVKIIKQSEDTDYDEEKP